MKLVELLTDLEADARGLYGKKVEIKSVEAIPDSSDIPLLNNSWLRLDDVTCVYADMVRSTELSVSRDAAVVGKLYELFTGNAVRILNEFGAEYIDVRGDGAFGLFTGDKGFYSAFAAGVTIKTFVSDRAAAIVKSSGLEFPLASHMGIQSGRLLVKRIGLRGDMQNEVWAGKPVNVAAKLASMASSNQLTVSSSAYDRFKSDLIYLSCGCQWIDGKRIVGDKVKLWDPIDVDAAIFGFDKAYVLKSNWCSEHGEATCNGILNL
jgi:class 3 adenylate cyclase